MRKHLRTIGFWVSLLPVMAGVSQWDRALGADAVGSIRDTQRIARRVTARDYNLFAFGPNRLDHLGVDGSGQTLRYGRVWETATHAAVTVAVEGAFEMGSANASIFAGSLGGNYYFTDGEFSPYLGGDFGYGVAVTNAEDIDNVSGWALGLSAGIAFFRTASVQLHAFGRYQRLLVDNGSGQPSHTSLGIGAAF